MNQKITVAKILEELRDDYTRHFDNTERDAVYSQCLQNVIAKLERLKTRLTDAINLYKAENVTEFDEGVIKGGFYGMEK